MELRYASITSHRARSLTLWAGAALFSLILNIALFGLMPSLISDVPDMLENTDLIQMVNVVRVKRPETPPKEKESKKQIEKKIPKEVSTLKKPVEYKQNLLMQQLPFEINPKLPIGPGTLPSPPMENIALQGHGLKGAYEIGEIDGPLTPLAQAPPVYPLRAKRLGIEGWVNVKFIVNEQGSVDGIEIIEANPEKIFEQSVIRCVTSWRFAPGTIEGVPVKTQVMTTIRFELE